MNLSDQNRIHLYDLPDDVMFLILEEFTFIEKFRLSRVCKGLYQRLQTTIPLAVHELSLSTVFNQSFFLYLRTQFRDDEIESGATELLEHILKFCSTGLNSLHVEIVFSNFAIFDKEFFYLLARYCPNLRFICFSMVHGLKPEAWEAMAVLPQIEDISIGKLIMYDSTALRRGLQGLKAVKRLEIRCPRSRDISWLYGMHYKPIESFKISGSLTTTSHLADLLWSISGTLTSLSIEIEHWSTTNRSWIRDLHKKLIHLKSLSLSFSHTVKTGAWFVAPWYADAFLECITNGLELKSLALGKGFARPDFVSAVGVHQQDLESLELSVTPGSWESHAAFLELKRLKNLEQLTVDGFKVDESLLLLLLVDIFPNLKSFSLRGLSNVTNTVMGTLALMPCLMELEMRIHSSSSNEANERLKQFLKLHQDCDPKEPLKVTLSSYADWDTTRAISLDTAISWHKLGGRVHATSKPGVYSIIVNRAAKDRIGSFS